MNFFFVSAHNRDLGEQSGDRAHKPSVHGDDAPPLLPLVAQSHTIQSHGLS